MGLVLGAIHPSIGQEAVAAGVWPTSPRRPPALHPPRARPRAGQGRRRRRDDVRAARAASAAPAAARAARCTSPILATACSAPTASWGPTSSRRRRRARDQAPRRATRRVQLLRRRRHQPRTVSRRAELGVDLRAASAVRLRAQRLRLDHANRHHDGRAPGRPPAPRRSTCRPVRSTATTSAAVAAAARADRRDPGRRRPAAAARSHLPAARPHRQRSRRPIATRRRWPRPSGGALPGPPRWLAPASPRPSSTPTGARRPRRWMRPSRRAVAAPFPTPPRRSRRPGRRRRRRRPLMPHDATSRRAARRWPRRCGPISASGRSARMSGAAACSGAVSRGWPRSSAPSGSSTRRSPRAAIMGVAVGSALTGTRPIAGAALQRLRRLRGRRARQPGCQGPLHVRRPGTDAAGGSPALRDRPFAGRPALADARNLVRARPRPRRPGPATPADNYGLLRAAIRSDDPVVHFEHKRLWQLEGEVPTPGRCTRSARRARVHDGDDVTLVAWSQAPVHVAHDAAPDARGRRHLGRARSTCARLWPWDKRAVLPTGGSHRPAAGRP